MKFVSISNEDRRKVQLLELEIFDELCRICEKYNIIYMVSYGSLIGAIRHNGYIPWDDDLDLCMMREDYDKCKEVCKKELDKRFFYQSHDTDEEYYYLFDKIRLNNTIFKESFVSKYNINHGVYIDIFPIDYIPENKIKRFLQYYSFHFFRTGVMAKYLMLGARSGKKKVIFSALRVLYSAFSLDYLYRMSQKIATMYDNTKHKKAANFFSASRKKDTFDSEVFLNLEKHLFEGREVWIPSQYDYYLKRFYGDYMKLPPEEQRNTRHSVVEFKI